MVPGAITSDVIRRNEERIACAVCLRADLSLSKSRRAAPRRADGRAVRGASSGRKRQPETSGWQRAPARASFPLTLSRAASARRRFLTSRSTA
jgi:hypothetical protein